MWVIITLYEEYKKAAIKLSNRSEEFKDLWEKLEAWNKEKQHALRDEMIIHAHEIHAGSKKLLIHQFWGKQGNGTGIHVFDGEKFQWVCNSERFEFEVGLSTLGVGWLEIEALMTAYDVLPKKSTQDHALFQNIQSETLLLKDLKYFQKLKKDKTFLIDGMIYPNTTTMFYSPPGQFKSLLALDMALSVATGGNFLGMKCKKYPVLYCDKENNEQLLKDRILGMWNGKNLKSRKLPLRFLTRNGDLMDEKFVKVLKEAIKQFKFKIVFFDTLHRFADYEENKADDINRLYTSVFQPLTDLGCSIVFLHHSKKDGGYRGSGDLLGMVDTCYNVFRAGKTGKFELNCEKSRAGEIEKIDGEVAFEENKIKIVRLNESLCEEKSRGKFKECCERITGLFYKADNPSEVQLSPTECKEMLEMEHFEISLETVKRAMKWLVERKSELAKVTKKRGDGKVIDTHKYCLACRVETHYIEENRDLGGKN